MLFDFLIVKSRLSLTCKLWCLGVSHTRLIARLDIRNSNLIKTINLEGVRKIGDPNEFAYRYFMDGIDEIVYMDVVASLYDRSYFDDIIGRTAENVFVPITAGGGIRTLQDVEQVLRSGADKIAVNTAAINNPDFIGEIAHRFGSQCMVLSIEAKRNGPKSWEAYCDGGREHTGRSVLEWAKEAQDRGAGEILLTSIDCEGVGKGMDVDLLKTINSNVTIPVIASGGVGKLEDLSSAVIMGGADAVAMAYVLHYEVFSVKKIREYALKEGIDVRVNAP